MEQPATAIRLWPLDEHGAPVNQRPGGEGILDGMLELFVESMLERLDPFSLP